MIRKYSIFIITLLISITVFAQKDDLKTKNKKAKEYYKQAMDLLPLGRYADAEAYLLQAIDKDDEFIDAYYLLGDLYFEWGKTEKAIEAYKIGIDLDPDYFPNALYNIGDLYLKEGKYTEAKTWLEKYHAHPNASKRIKPRAELKIKKCDFAVEAMKHPVPYKPINAGPNINTKEREYYPCLTVDDKTLLFTRIVRNPKARHGMHEDFFVSTRKDSSWLPSYNMGPPINTIYNEGAPTISPDGRYIILTACEVYGNYGEGRYGFGSCDLFLSERKGRNWTAPANLGKTINTPNWESQPSFSTDGRTLYFIRGYKGGGGVVKNQDIMVTHYLGNGEWSEPQSISDKINTPYTEEFVHIHPDGRTLYFSSDGHPGMGGLDIYMSRKDDNGEWGEPVNLGYPINTCKDENSILVFSDGRLAFFASARDGGYGELDLYLFEIPPQFRPDPVTYMKGIVFDAETKEKLQANFELIDLKSGEVIVHSNSDPIDGDFLVALPSGREYALNVNKEGYMFYSGTFAIDRVFKRKDPYLMNIPLKRGRVGDTIILKNIFFDTDKYDLKPESHIELAKLVELLNKNITLKIEIAGHTDNVGSDEHNEELSENRAKAVYDYLLENGISKNRLQYKGYGEKVPIDTNDTEVGRANNRRTEFIIKGL